MIIGEIGRGEGGHGAARPPARGSFFNYSIFIDITEVKIIFHLNY